MKHKIAVVLLISVVFLAAGCSSITNPFANKQIATVKNISVSITGGLLVEIQPTDNAVTNHAYVVGLYEKGKLRDSQLVVFNQPQINIHDSAYFTFGLTHDEWEAYMFKDISGIFFVKVIDMQTSTHTPTTSKR